MFTVRNIIPAVPGLWEDTPIVGKENLHKIRLNESKILIQKGADINLQDNSGKTPLMMATSGEIVDLLLQNKADVNARGGS